jgi:EpsD family peptidyl-prolyl cis-trans isomerase
MINLRSSAAVLIALSALAACTKPPAPSARVAARVNGADISVHEFQMVVHRAAQTAQQPAPAPLMEGLIDRKLLAQKAAALKLDHAPTIALLLDEAKEEILAQAYLANLIGWSAEDESAITAFYDENPRLFAERHLYRVVELAVVAPQDRMHELTQRAKRARGVYEITAWLKKQEFPYNVGAVTKASEELAPQLLSRLESMQEGEIVVLQSASGASVLQLLQSDPAPLSRDAAAPIIEKALRARKHTEAAERERKYLRSKASIEYVVDLGGQPTKQATATAADEPVALIPW